MGQSNGDVRIPCKRFSLQSIDLFLIGIRLHPLTEILNQWEKALILSYLLCYACFFSELAEAPEYTKAKECPKMGQFHVR
jgi:hypothetical protein